VGNGSIREKPEDNSQCREFLRSYKDFPAVCVTAVVVTNTDTRETYEGVDVATQHFFEIPETAMEELIKQGDVLSCAGGFAIEHMSPFLKKLEGEQETVTGLPKTLTKRLLDEAEKHRQSH